VPPIRLIFRNKFLRTILFQTEYYIRRVAVNVAWTITARNCGNIVIFQWPDRFDDTAIATVFLIDVERTVSSETSIAVQVVTVLSPRPPAPRSFVMPGILTRTLYPFYTSHLVLYRSPSKATRWMQQSPWDADSRSVAQVPFTVQCCQQPAPPDTPCQSAPPPPRDTISLRSILLL
jgi:hypothetical protein